ncbi:FAR-RED impaired response 1-like protein [Tanacetum coccineum]
MGFSFLDKEQGPNFRWVLQCVKKVIDEVHYPRVIVTDRDLALMGACDVEFPNAKKLLCRWHISNNMLKHCRQRFKTVKEWDSVKYTWEHMIKAPTEAGFEHYYEKLKELLVGHREVSEYLNNWLENYRHMFVSVLTDQYLSYGESTTCRVESQHALLKKYLGTAQSNLDTLLSSIDKIIIGQETAIKESFNRSINVRKHKFNIPQFEELWGQVSHYALDYILEELGRPNSEECGCLLRASYGLPCAHELLFHDVNDVPWPIAAEDDGLNCQNDVRKFQNALSKVTTFVKKNWLTKLRGIQEPESVSIREPVVHKNTRGSPSAKDKKKQSNQFVPPTADPHRQQTIQFVPSVVDPPRRSYSKPTKVPDVA